MERLDQQAIPAPQVARGTLVLPVTPATMEPQVLRVQQATQVIPATRATLVKQATLETTGPAVMAEAVVRKALAPTQHPAPSRCSVVSSTQETTTQTLVDRRVLLVTQVLVVRAARVVAVETRTTASTSFPQAT